MVDDLKNIAILNARGVNYKCILWNISRDEVVNRLNNFVLEDKINALFKWSLVQIRRQSK